MSLVFYTLEGTSGDAISISNTDIHLMRHWKSTLTSLCLSFSFYPFLFCLLAEKLQCKPLRGKIIRLGNFEIFYKLILAPENNEKLEIF